jgi:hypothetical protein
LRSGDPELAITGVDWERIESAYGQKLGPKLCEEGRRMRSIRQGILEFPPVRRFTEEKCRQIGLARCPFDITNFEVKDGHTGLEKRAPAHGAAAGDWKTG